jgi:hypothetical protein
LKQQKKKRKPNLGIFTRDISTTFNKKTIGHLRAWDQSKTPSIDRKKAKEGKRTKRTSEPS